MSGSHSRKCRRISSDLLRRSLARRSLPSWVDEALGAIRGRGAERPVRGTSQPARGRPRMNTVRAHVQNVLVKLARIQRAKPPYSRVHGASTLVVAVCYAILPICPGKPRTRNCPTAGEFAVWGDFGLRLAGDARGRNCPGARKLRVWESPERVAMRKLIVLLALMLAATVGMVPMTGGAQALEADTVVANSTPTWQTNGTVWALAYANGVVYASGDFTSVRPPGAALGTGEVARNHLAAFNASTGDLLP